MADTTLEQPADTGAAPEAMSPEALSYLDQLDRDAGYPSDADADTETAPAAEAPANTTAESPAEEKPADEHEASGADTATDWRDDEVKSLAASMGIDDAYLAKMPSREAFEAATILRDMELAAQGRQLQQPPAEESAAQQPHTGQAEPPAAAKSAVTATTPATGAVPPDLQQYLDTVNRLAADPEFDPEVVGVLKGSAAITQTLATQLAELKREQEDLVAFARWQTQQMQQQQQAHDLYQFHEQLSALDPDLFGKDWESATPAQRTNREKVAPEVVALRYAEHQRRGQYVVLDKPLVTRAYRVAFGDKLVERAKQQKSQQIAAQSRQRLGGAARKHTPYTPPPKSGDLTEDDGLLTEVRSLLDKERE